MTEAGRPSRRDLIRLGVAAAAALALPSATARARPLPPRALAFRNLHTGDLVERVYWAEGRLVPEALREIDRVLRDHRSGEARRIDPRLLDLLSALRTRLDTSEPFEVISGYRSPATNAMLAKATSGVATGSLHVRAMAIDVRVPGQPLTTLRDAALALRRGGVGFYPDSDFVHVDVGRIRVW